MISAVILLGVAALVASAPTENKNTIIYVEAPEGRHHVQTGEPGKAVSDYFTSRDLDGVEGKTMYVADENGFRATGDHLPVSPIVSPLKLLAAFPSVYPRPSFLRYGYRFDPESYYLNYPFYNPNIFNPNVPGGKLVSAKDYLTALNEDDTTLTEQEMSDLSERGPLTPVLFPMMLMNKKNIMLMMLANKIMMALG